MYPTDCTSPKFYGMHKIHKTGTPSGLFIKQGSGTYGVSEVLAKVLRPLVGKAMHHIQSTKNFVNRVSKVTPLPGECLYSYDVTALFTSVPIIQLLIRELLEHDVTLWDRIVLSVQNIIDLLGFCLHNTYFSFQNKFYEEVEGAAMESPVSPIVANLCMEYFEKKASVLPPSPQTLVQVCG